LLPVLGARASLRTGIAVNLVLAAGLFLLPRPVTSRRWTGITASLIIAGGMYFVRPWDQRLMSSGPAIYGHLNVAARENAGGASAPVAETLFYRDGSSSTVAVLRRAGNTFLRVNGKTDASTSGDMPTQTMLGHLPMLVHPSPRTILVVGLGSGMTAAAVARHPIEHLDIAEIEPAVVEAARFFAAWTGDVLRDPRVRL